MSVKMLGGRNVGEAEAPQWSNPMAGGLCESNSAGLSPLDLFASSLPTLLHFPSVDLQTLLPASSLGTFRELLTDGVTS